jgi:glycolate oxidase iron-sulfur subunit
MLRAFLIHTGEIEQAQELAQKNFSAFSVEVDAILTNAAGCGSGLHEYRQLFQGLEHEQQAEAIADKAVDVSHFLDQLGLVYAPELPQPLRVAYHDACHLAHAQGITDSPRRLLSAITNLSSSRSRRAACCGSAARIISNSLRSQRN